MRCSCSRRRATDPARGLTRRAALAAGLSLGVAPAPAAAESAAPEVTAAAAGGVPADRLARLARGFNLTGWLDVREGRAPDRQVLKSLLAAGLTHVRLPVVTEFYGAGEIGGAERFRMLARATDDLIRLGFAVILDMHPGAEIGALRRTDPARASAAIEALWWRLAGSFADRPPGRLLFEILNEPVTAAEFAEATRLAGIVRRLAPEHTIILGPPTWQRIEALEALTPIADRNVVYAIHLYDPMAFTHQGQDWDGPEEPLALFSGVPFPSRWDAPPVRALERRLRAEGHAAAAQALEEQLSRPWGTAEIEAIVERAARWSRAHDAPVVIGEFGVLSWKAAPADRARWLRTVRVAAETRRIGWTHWDYADGFGLARRDREGREAIDPPILAALTGR